MTFAHLGDVLDEVAPLGRLFADAGHRLFLVGGIVRDQWLDGALDTSSDIDLTTDALPADIKRIVASFAEVLWTQGEKFGTIGLRAAGRDYEITTHRAETYSSDSRKPVVSFGDKIEVDLSRRDFTVNAMAIELPDGELIDPHDGVVDLADGRLRTPLSADISFTDDPLRMLRAARFATKYKLVPDNELATSATMLHERLRIVAIERIGVEIRRLLGLDDARTGLTFLADTGLLAEVLAYGKPALVDTVHARQHSAIDAADRLRSDWHLRLAAVGIAIFDTAEGVQAMAQRLRLSRDDERRITHTAASAIAVIEAADINAETLRRWLSTCDDVPEAIELARAVTEDQRAVDRFASAVATLAAQEQTTDLWFLDGRKIMSLLAIEPGPAVGKAHAFLQQRYFERGPLPKDDQIALLTAWWQEQ